MEECQYLHMTWIYRMMNIFSNSRVWACWKNAVLPAFKHVASQVTAFATLFIGNLVARDLFLELDSSI